MSLSEDIRAALARSGDPLSGSELCDAMGAEDRDERNRICSCASAMVQGRKGIERDELGKYMLIPGWKPYQRNGTVAATDDANTDQVEAKLKATTHVEIKADALTDQQVEVLRKVAATSGHIVLAPGIGKAAPAPSTSATATANTLVRRIAEYLNGVADCDPVRLLREAREEILQLDFAARMALEGAEQLAERLREATQ